MSLALNALTEAIDALDGYAARAGLIAGPLPMLVTDLRGIHAELVADHDRGTAQLEELLAEARERDAA